MTEYRLHIRGVTLERPEALAETYPFQIPLLRHGLSLRFEHPITFLVGENGSGKSTIIEALAVAAGLNAEGGSSHTRYSSCPTHSDLHRFLRLDPGYRIKYGYFLRAEAFYAYATWLDQDHEEHVREAMQGPSIRSTAFGHSLHTRSHGEAFWDIIDNQFHDGGLYLLDEPESALSVIRQMALLYRMDELITRGCQFIIATHSPLLVSARHAGILEIDDDGTLRATDLAHCRMVNTYRTILNQPGSLYRGT